MAITDWLATERPREKLLQLGTQALSDAELLAIFLRTGVKGMTAVDLSRNLLEKFGGLRGVLEADYQQFCEAPGLGIAKYSQLQATLEMGRRHLLASLQKGEALKNPLLTAQYLTVELRKHRGEVFAALFLDNQHRVIAFEKLFFGGIREIAIYPRELARKALLHNAAAVIVAHNHPSGDATPSDADKELTWQLKRTLALLEINLIDHIIIGDTQVFSFVQEGLLV